MDRKTIHKRVDENAHPYREFEGTTLWNRVNKAVSALVKNGDIKETTRREYIVGYVCKAIGTAPMTNPKGTRSRRAENS